MGRPSGHSTDTKLRIVLSVLRGETTCAEAARRHGVSETSIGKWKRQFLDAGRQGLAASGQRRAPGGREAQLAGEVDERQPRRRGVQKYRITDIMVYLRGA